MTVGSVNDDNITCLTDHLTSFTMVILSKEVTRRTDDFSGIVIYSIFLFSAMYSMQVTTSDERALTVIYYIGSGLSLAGLMFSSVVYVAL